MSNEVEHTEDCGTHMLGEPCCDGYVKWLTSACGDCGICSRCHMLYDEDYLDEIHTLEEEE